MTTPYADVAAFHARFDLPRLGDPTGQPPHLLAPDVLEFRLKFLHEELAELTAAHAAGDLAGFLDGLVDLVYVALGTAHLAHLPFDAAWAAVHAANLTKVRATPRDPRSTRDHPLDVVKPPSWNPPDIERVIADHEAKIRPTSS